MLFWQPCHRVYSKLPKFFLSNSGNKLLKHNFFKEKKTFFDYDVPLDTYKSVLTIFSKSLEELPLSFVSKTKIDQNFETFQQQVFLKIRLNTENALFTTLPKTFLRKYKNFAARSPKRIETFIFFQIKKFLTKSFLLTSRKQF